MSEVTPERWLPVVGFEGFYEVSDLGRVRSVDHVVTDRINRTRQIIGRILKPSLTFPYGHRQVVMTARGARVSRTVHSLVAAAFLGPRPLGLEVCHNNGVRTDNRVENLRYDTHSENLRDSVRHGTNVNARKTHCPAGHPYDQIKPRHRGCSICVAASDKLRKLKRGVSA